MSDYSPAQPGTGNKRTRPPRHGQKPSRLWHIRAESRLSGSDFAKAHELANVQMVRQAEKGTLHPGSPHMEALAKAYGLPLEELRKEASRHATAKRVPRGDTDDTVTAGKRVALRSGRPVVVGKTNGAGPKRAYNSLSRYTSPEVRQFVRTLSTEVNVCAMKGNRYVQLPALPIELVGAFLTEFMTAKGIAAPMILSPDWADHFDSKVKGKK